MKLVAVLLLLLVTVAGPAFGQVEGQAPPPAAPAAPPAAVGETGGSSALRWVALVLGTAAVLVAVDAATGWTVTTPAVEAAYAWIAPPPPPVPAVTEYLVRSLAISTGALSAILFRGLDGTVAPAPASGAL